MRAEAIVSTCEICCFLMRRTTRLASETSAVRPTGFRGRSENTTGPTRAGIFCSGSKEASE